MMHIIQKTSLFLTLTVAVIVMGYSTFVATAEAQYYSAEYYQMRADLIAQVNKLLAELQALESQQVYSYTPSYQQPGYYYPGGQVLGADTFSRYNVEVETAPVGPVYDDEAKLYGDIDLNGAPYATVWFEYGETRSFGERTYSARMDYRVSDTFRADLEDLDENETYYFRAVAEDPAGYRTYGRTYSFETDDDRRSHRNDDDDPDVETDSADDVDEDSAELRGEVDMNDFNNGLVFFVYGEDEDQVEEIEDEYDEYRDIDEDGDDLQKVIVDNDLDSDDDYERRVSGLDDDTDHYFSICVEYEDEDDDEVIRCGGVEDFETDRE